MSSDVPKIRPSDDRKVKFKSKHMNTFGLAPGLPAEGGTCPGCTEGVGGCWKGSRPGGVVNTCYVDKLRRAYKQIGEVLEHNTQILQAATFVDKVNILTAEFERFKSKSPSDMLYYRLHWSGDIFDKEYALVLLYATAVFPEITFWIYTRSFEYVKYIAGCDNLIVFVSLDEINAVEGLKTYAKYANDGVRCSFMTKDTDTVTKLIDLAKSDMSQSDAEKLDDILPQMAHCPVDSGKLATDFACYKCRKCIDLKPNANKHIWFKLRQVC